MRIVRHLIVMLAAVAAASCGQQDAAKQKEAAPAAAAQSPSAQADVARSPRAAFLRIVSTPGRTEFEGSMRVSVRAVTDSANLTLDVETPQGVARANVAIAAQGAGARIAIALTPMTYPTASAPALAKALTEALAADIATLPETNFDNLQFDVATYPARPFLYAEGVADQSAGSLPVARANAIAIVRETADRTGLARTGAPLIVAKSSDGARFSFRAGYPVSGQPPRILSAASLGETPSGAALHVRYQGPEEGALHIYDQLEALAAAARLTLGPSMEALLSNPELSAVNDREIYWFIETGDPRPIEQFAMR